MTTKNPRSPRAAAQSHARKALPLDHLVINTHFEMNAAHTIFEQLGFTLTPRGRHSLGSINHLMVFENDYLELLGLPSDGGPLREEVLSSPVGIDGLVFKTTNAAHTHQSLQSAGFAVQPVQAFSRPVELAGVVSDARFETVRFEPGQFSAGRLYYCQHFTPELVWRKEWQAHPNGVNNLAGLLIVCESPQQEAKQYVAAAGGLAALGANGEYRVRGAQYTLVFVTAVQYAECFGGLTCVGGKRSSFFGAIALQTASLAPLRQALERLQKNGLHTITWREQRGRLSVQIPGFNTLLEFVDTDIA
ncbi:MAG: VOC family protein [Alcaligenaceae bacterium]|nr:VOC family protein [Alcaligenaceae bacterium]